MMPEMDRGGDYPAHPGTWARKDPYFAVVPIIALTANAMKGVREEFLQSGFNDYISKPVELDKLDDVLRAWVPEDKQKAPRPPPGRPGGRAHPRGTCGTCRTSTWPGHSYCGTGQVYRKTLFLFRKADPAASGASRQAWDEGRWEDYVIEVQPEKRRPVDWRHGPGRPG